MSMQANLTKYTEEEIKHTLKQIFELDNQGKKEEAKILKIRSLPIVPETANFLKNKFGLAYLFKHQINLSRTVEKYGIEWLEK